MKPKREQILATGAVLLLSFAHLLAEDVSVPQGTQLKLVLKTPLSTKTNRVGDPFTAELAEPLVVSGKTALSAGTQITGIVSHVEGAKRLAGLKGGASMVLRFERIKAQHGDVPITATLLSVHDPADPSKVREASGEGEVKAKQDIKGTLTKGAIGVGAGAILGAIFGNVARGVALGSVAGAVAILAPKGKEVELAQGSGLIIRLDEPIKLPAQ